MFSIDNNDTDLELDLFDAVHRLTPKQRVVVAMLSAGYTQKEVARVIGNTRAAVGIIYKRARILIETYLRG